MRAPKRRRVEQIKRVMLRSNIFSIEFINSIPKTVNENGCWIPTKNKSDGDGYVRLSVGPFMYAKRYKLHRIVMCVYCSVDYDNKKIETRHSQGCDRACFNPEHLKPGSHINNCNDAVRDKTHHNSKKEVCPKCGGEYRQRARRRNGKRVWIRECLTCAK